MSTQHAAPKQTRLTDLPVELFIELYLVALSPALPHTCKHIYNVVKSFPPSINAQYLLGRHPPTVHVHRTNKRHQLSGSLLTWTLPYPICTVPVLDAMLNIISRTSVAHLQMNGSWPPIFELPKRLFRPLGEPGATLDSDSEPLPLLRYLWNWNQQYPDMDLPAPFLHSHGGYPLVRAVHARFIPLVRFLLDHGADPGQRDAMAVKVAIGKRDLVLVKMLIEYEPEPGPKQRRRMDRLRVQPFMLDLAVRSDARDIVQYLMQEKGCVPDMKTLKAI